MRTKAGLIELIARVYHLNNSIFSLVFLSMLTKECGTVGIVPRRLFIIYSEACKFRLNIV